MSDNLKIKINELAKIKEFEKDILILGLNFESIKELEEQLSNENDEQRRCEIKEKLNEVLEQEYFCKIQEQFECTKKEVEVLCENTNYPDIRNIDTKEEYCNTVIEELVTLLKKYKEAMIEKVGPNGKVPTCESFVKYVLKKEILEKEFKSNDNNHITELKKKYEDKLKKEIEPIQYTEFFDDLITKNNKVEYKIVDLLKKYYNRLEFENVFSNPLEVLENIARYQDFNNEVFKIKHFDTLNLLFLEQEEKNGMYILHTPKKNREKGVVCIIEDNGYQMVSGHYEDDEKRELEEFVFNAPNEPDYFKRLFEDGIRMREKEGRMVLNTYIPNSKLIYKKERDEKGEDDRGEEKKERIINDCKELSKTINCLEGKSNLSDEEKAQLPMYTELLELKTRDHYSYMALSNRFLMLAGKEKFLEFNGIMSKKNQQLIRDFHDQKSDEFFIADLIRNDKVSEMADYLDIMREGSKIMEKVGEQEQERESEI